MSKQHQYRSFIIQPDGKVEEHIHPKTPDLDWLQKAVGGLIETLPYFTKYKDRTRGTAYANEEGLLLQLPYNQPATAAWKKCFPAAQPLVGPVVITFREKIDG